MRLYYRRSIRAIVLLLSCVGNAWTQRRSEALASQVIGFYHWGGQAPRSISEGMRAIEKMHGRIARIALSPRYHTDYHATATALCDTNFRLAASLEDADVQTALDTPGIEVILITAYDGVSYRDCATHSYLVPSFYTPANRAALKAEYADFVFILAQRYAGSGKRFILANWEGDNTIYCGQAFRYAWEAAFREECNSNYPKYYAGNRNPGESMQGLIAWFRGRYEGVAEGKRRAMVAGFEGVEIELALEFSVVHALHDNGFSSVLYDVIPTSPFDYVSYSAYETINRSNPAAQLESDLELIRAVAGTTRIILGEVGYARSLWGERAIANLSQVVECAVRWGVPYLIHWNLYDQDAQSDFGLYDTNGSATVTAEYFAGLLAKESRSRNAGRQHSQVE